MPRLPEGIGAAVMRARPTLLRRRIPRRESLAVALLAAVLTGIFALAGGIGPADRLLYDMIATRLPGRAAEQPVVIVAIDEPSFAELGLAWPWPREVHARLVESLREAGARAVAFDIVFADPGQGDAALAAAMGPDVVLATDRVIVETPQGRIDMVVVPLAELTAAGARTGHVAVPLDADGAVRRLPDLPGSFAAELLRPVVRDPSAGAALDPAAPAPPIAAGSSASGAGPGPVGIGGRPATRPPDEPFATAAPPAPAALAPEGTATSVSAGPVTAVPRTGALIDYRQPPDQVPRVSYYQALEAARLLPPETFRGKVALVGLSLRAAPDPGADRFRTPWTARGAGLMPGVEVQARIAATFASGSPAWPAPPWLAPVAALAAAFLGVVAARGRVAPVAAIWAGGIAALLVGGSAALLAGGLWLPPATPALAALAAGLGQAGLDHRRERRARRAITRSFEHYVAPAVVRRLARDPAALRLGGERRRVTILFCDLRGFTRLSEQMGDDPEALTALVNRALTVVADAILASDGLVDKFIGDCAMGLWNAPLDLPDHPRRAVEAGLAAIRGIERLNRELAAEAAAEGRVPPVLACGVGVNTGECTVGNMGSAARFDYTALGDPVNVASRLEGLTAVYGVPMLVGEATVAEAGREAFVELDAAEVKGRSAPVRIFLPAELWPAAAQTLQARAVAAGDRPEATLLWRQLATSEPAAARYAGLMEARVRTQPPASAEAS